MTIEQLKKTCLSVTSLSFIFPQEDIEEKKSFITLQEIFNQLDLYLCEYFDEEDRQESGPNTRERVLVEMDDLKLMVYSRCPSILGAVENFLNSNPNVKKYRPALEYHPR